MSVSFEDYVNIELEETEIQAINNFLSRHGIQCYLENLVTCCNYNARTVSLNHVDPIVDGHESIFSCPSN